MATATPDVVALIAPHTERLLATARSLGDPGAPSLCAGWSRGHVLTHVARNADGLCALVRAAVDGTGETMYPSPQARDADIEAGAGRALADLVGDVERTAAALADLLPRLGAEHAGTRLERTPGVFIAPAGLIPLLRLREVVFHHVDLDAGFGFADVEPDLVRLFLDEEVQRVRESDDAPDVTLGSPDGTRWTIGGGTASVAGSPAALLGWLSRGLTDALTADHLPRPPKGR